MSSLSYKYIYIYTLPFSSFKVDVKVGMDPSVYDMCIRKFPSSGVRQHVLLVENSGASTIHEKLTLEKIC